MMVWAGGKLQEGDNMPVEKVRKFWEQTREALAEVDMDASVEAVEESVGNLSRALYEVRQKSPGAIPSEITGHVSQIADAIVDVKRQLGSLRRAGRDLENLLEVSNALNQERPVFGRCDLGSI
ncbi:MAG: hypothetical protein IH921_08030 [Gemmatimonadetes bacterium]|nr:hypothetical protein [Gemmatimonadota bacterium]